VDWSVNWTVSGADPEVGVAVNAATGTAAATGETTRGRVTRRKEASSAIKRTLSDGRDRAFGKRVPGGSPFREAQGLGLKGGMLGGLVS